MLDVFDSARRRYHGGEWRAPLFYDLIRTDLRKAKMERPGETTVLDIGCGSGFDGDISFQRKISEFATEYIGIEPDADIAVGDCFTTVLRAPFEEASVPAGTIDLAYCVMVLEHVESPDEFWSTLFECLRPGGVFWGFTVDARHWFTYASRLTELFRVKDWYLTVLHGERGVDRFENYPTFYRCNTPRRIRRDTRRFSKHHFINFLRVGQMDYYLPRRLRWIGRSYDHLAEIGGLPGSIMAIRLTK